MSERTPLLILGLGNILCTDDGVGAVAVHRLLRAYDAPAGVRVLDGGTLGLSLLPLLEEADAVILVDAIRGDGAAGTLVRIEGEDVAPAVAARLSVHQVGVADLLDSARLLGRCPPRLVLVGIVPADLGLGVALSPAVAAGLPRLLSAVADEARSLGFPLLPREADAPDPLRDADGVAVALRL
jgi:hydrogenase maturation protease